LICPDTGGYSYNVEGIPAMLKNRGWRGGTAPTPNLNYSGRCNPPVVTLHCCDRFAYCDSIGSDPSFKLVLMISHPALRILTHDPSIARNPSITRNLSFVRKKNLMVDVPLQLRLSSSLRVSCSIIQRIYFNGLDINLLEKDKQRYQYSNLYRQLCCLNPQWWNTCQVSKEGSVISNDKAIATLLHPLYQLHLTFMGN
jgi:hypothetical protein